MKHRFGSLFHVIDNTKYSFGFIWSHSKAYVFIIIINSILSGIYTPLTFLLTNRLFVNLEQNRTLQDFVAVLILLAAVYTIQIACDVLFSEVIQPIFAQKLHEKVQNDLFLKAKHIKLKKYDDPDFYNDYILAMQDADTYTASALENISNLIGVTFSFISILSILIYIDSIVMLMILLSVIISMIIKNKIKKTEFYKQQDSAQINRKKNYIDRIFKLSDYAKELRLTELAKVLKREYNDNMHAHIDLSEKYGKAMLKMKIPDEINMGVTDMFVLLYVLYRMVIKHTITLGGFAIVVNAHYELGNVFQSLASAITELPEQSLHIDKVRMFLENEELESGGTEHASAFESLEFKDVCFNYNEDAEILHRISLKINKGEKIAIVGYNGAGKSTLIKLLMNLYQPDKGEILYNGKNVQNYDITSYRSHIGVVFQDYQIFGATIGENVLCDYVVPEAETIIHSALKQVGFNNKLSRLPKGIDTILTREFDESGTNLSGGEMQKIAIARVFVKPYDLIVMDEPSSSLDPIAEYNLNREIQSFAKDKTVIFISHRLSTTKNADKIYMFENGSIIEQGNHDELMKSDGKYAKMFKIQSEKYIR